jgi:hypothetical protein
MGLHPVWKEPKVGVLACIVACGLFVTAPDAGLCASHDSPKTAVQPAAGSRTASPAIKFAQNSSPASKPAEGSGHENSAASSLCDNNRCSQFERRSPTTDIPPGTRPEYRVPGINDVLGNFHSN